MLNIVRKLTQVNALSRSTSSIGNLVDILSASHRNAQTRPHTHTHHITCTEGYSTAFTHIRSKLYITRVRNTAKNKIRKFGSSHVQD